MASRARLRQFLARSLESHSMSGSLFDTTEPPPLAARLAPLLRSWADRGIYFGGSSWKYEGWLGSVYTPEKYFTRNKFSRKKFEENCLLEYAETFPTVGGDFSFYQFPSAEFWSKLFAGLPSAFSMGLKVPEAVTVNVWPGHARYGKRAGLPNEHFLDAGLFGKDFLEPLMPHRERVGVVMFEFGAFSRKDFPSPDAFLQSLDRFLGDLPTAWPYAVEIRNKDYLGSDYFALLSQHGISHVFNAWTRMPALSDQIAMPGAFTAETVVVRALLQHGRTYEQAVKMFEPYTRVQEAAPETRTALRQIAEQCVRERRKAYIFVNNRLEGCSPETIEAVAATE
jgi:uncharacterized protein YecE (DUF72 family)